MQIDLDISRYNKSMYSSITLHTTSCQAMYMSTKISIGTRLGACGTTTKTVGDTIIYENQVILTAQHTGMISRRPDISLKVTCNLPSSGYAQSTGHSILNEVNATERKSKLFNVCLYLFFMFLKCFFLKTSKFYEVNALDYNLPIKHFYHSYPCVGR